MKKYTKLSFHCVLVLLMLQLKACCSEEAKVEPPKVELIDVKFYTNHKFSPGITTISNTFRSVTLSCTAKYPTTWKFFKPVYQDPTLKDISISNRRHIDVVSFGECITNCNCSSTFTSILILNFKYVDKFPKLLCRSSKNDYMSNKTSTFINASAVQNNPLELKFEFPEEDSATADDYLQTESNRVGGNKGCFLRLYFNKKDKDDIKFDCGWANGTNASKPIPTIITCKTRDECRSSFRPDTHNCTGTQVDGCPLDGNCTYKFEPTKSPGIIFCRDPKKEQNYTDDSIARTYIVTQSGGTYFGIDGPKKDELLVVKDVSEVYRNQTVRFTCSGTSSFYMHGFQYVLEVLNPNNSTDDTIMLYLGGGNENVDWSETFSYTVTKDITFNDSSIQPNSSANVTVRVFCYAPMWDDFKWKTANITFLVKEPEKPKILAFNVECNSTDGISKVLIFNCTAYGKPKPEIAFWWNGLDAFKDLQDLVETSNFTDNYTIVQWVRFKNGAGLKWDKTSVEHVSCNASNFHGKALKRGSWKDNRACVSDDRIFLHWAIGILAVGLVVSSLIGIYFTKRYRNRFFTLGDAEIEAFTKGDPASDEAFLRPYKLEFEIPREEIDLQNDIIGEGQFAKVVFATWRTQKVAVKIVKKSADVKHFKDFLSEIKTMCYIERHPNLVNIVGACTRNIKQRDVLLVIEFCSNGNLLKYLKKSQSAFIDLSGPEEVDQKKTRLRTLRGHERRKISCAPGSISTINLLTWAVQCASAMEYLSLKRLVHGDLAARNILLTEQLHAKVGDFGLSKQLSDYAVYVQSLNCPLPLRWMSIEALQDLEFSIPSDIWSFGILLWEMFSLGQLPYPGIPQWDFQSYIFLKEGHRMEKPKYSPESIYAIMKDCWEEKPERRPAFEKLKERLIAELLALQC